MFLETKFNIGYVKKNVFSKMKKKLFSEESPPMLLPIATSTPTRTTESHSSTRQDILTNENQVPTNQLIELMNSTIDNEVHIDMKPDEPMNMLPVGVASNDLFSKLEVIVREKVDTQKQNKSVQSGNLTKENADRLNRSNFFVKNIVTSMTYMDVFISITTQYPLAQFSTTQNMSKIQYICVAGNVLLLRII